MQFSEPSAVDSHRVIAQTRVWVDQFVVGMNLCPFARREVVRGTLRYTVYPGSDVEGLLVTLEQELATLWDNPDIETTLLIHPHALQDFLEYNDCLVTCEALLSSLQLDGVFQVASFHPRYQFAGTDANDAENYTNRSPYPMLHLLREDSISRAVDHYPDIDQVPERNIARLKALGTVQLRAMLADCLS